MTMIGQIFDFFSSLPNLRELTNTVYMQDDYKMKMDWESYSSVSVQKMKQLMRLIKKSLMIRIGNNTREVASTCDKNTRRVLTFASIIYIENTFVYKLIRRV